MLAFGTENALPSFEWVGKDIAIELEKQHEIEFYRAEQFEIQSNVIFVVKIMPSLAWIYHQKQKNKTLIYIPIDYFSRPSELTKYSVCLSLFDGIFIHNNRLGDKIKRYNKRLFFIDHYLKYSLARQPAFKQDGFLLWIGHLEYIASLIITLRKTPLKFPIKVLSDLEKLQYYRAALHKSLQAHGIDWTEERLDNGNMNLCGVEIEQWSAARQYSYLTECKAAFDTKFDSFAHNLKPPTKAQKYIFNGIPFAMDKGSYSSEYFHQLGLNIPDITDTDYWLSEAYFNQIQTFSAKYKVQVLIHSVARSYLTHLTTIEQDNYERPRLPAISGLRVKHSAVSVVALLLKIKEKLMQKLS